MVKIKISGWNVGLNTVHAIKEVRERAGCSLGEAMAVVNRVLDNKEAFVELPSQEAAAQLFDSLTSMGMPSELFQEDHRLQEHAT